MQGITEVASPHVQFILLSGGVISGIGKGLTASSLGVLLKCCGWRVTEINIDPYLNIDAGTMSPEHGDVFVLNDGGEVDLDLGNDERDLDVTISRDNNITMFMVGYCLEKSLYDARMVNKMCRHICHCRYERGMMTAMLCGFLHSCMLLLWNHYEGNGLWPCSLSWRRR